MTDSSPGLTRRNRNTPKTVGLTPLTKNVERYTPETVENICGTPKAKFLKVAEIVTSSGNAERVGTILYALGWTQHSTGVQIIRTAAMLQLLLGNVGRPGGGGKPRRGHANHQAA